MFDIGFTELVLVAVIGLLILGPERMPVAVRTIGLWVGKIKRTVGGVQKEIQDELRIDEIRKKADENRKAIEDRMTELAAETDIMEAPVEVAQENRPANKTEAKPASKAAKKPASKAASKPASKAAKKPASKAASKPPSKASKKVEQKEPSIGGS